MNKSRSVVVTEKAPKGGGLPPSRERGAVRFRFGARASGSCHKRTDHGTFSDQVNRTFDNIEAILAAAGTGLSDLAKVTVYLSDLGRVPEFNALYEARVPALFLPARSSRRAESGIDVELDVIAVRSGAAAAEPTRDPVMVLDRRRHRRHFHGSVHSGPCEWRVCDRQNSHRSYRPHERHHRRTSVLGTQ